MTPPDPNYEDDLFPNDLPLPESLQWESMEDGILTKMDTIQKRKHKRRFIFWLFPLLLIGGMGIGWWSFTADGFGTAEHIQNELDTDDFDYQSSNDDEAGQANSIQTKELTMIGETAVSSPSHDTSPNLKASVEALVDKNSFSNATKSNQLASPRETLVARPKKTATDTKNEGGTSIDPMVDAPSVTNPSSLPTSLPQSSLSDSPTFSATVPTEDVTTALQIDPLDYLLTLPPAAIEIEPRERLTEQTTAKADFQPFLRAQLSGGLNWFSGNYRGADENFVMLRQESEYYDPGTQLSVRLERGFAPGVFFGSGFDYKTYRTRLDTEAQSTISRLNSMVLLRFNEDPITGDSTNQEYGDTVLTVHQLRRVRHYNRYTSLEIPLYLGYEFEFGRFDLALTGGFSASISREMNGRIFDRNGEVVDLGEEAFVSYRTGISLAVAGGLRLGYRLTDKFSITLGGGYQSFVSNWMENSTNALNSRPTVWSTNTGIAWRF